MATADRLEYVLAGRDELTKPLRQAEGQMKRLGNQAQRTNKQMGAFSSNLANAQKGTRAFAMGSLQQAGYQVGDFAVQIANGTNKMQAFGQQAPQFLQIFGPIGSVVGAAVAVFAAAAVMIEKTQATAENLTKAVDKATASINAFSSSAKNSNKSIAELAKEYGLMAAQAKEFFEVQNEINRLVAFRDVAAAIDMATASFGEFGDRTVGALHDQGEAFDALIHKITSLRKEGEGSQYFDIEQGLNRQLLIAEESLNRLASDGVVKLAKELGVSGSAAAFLAEEISKAQRAEKLEDRVKGLVEVRRLYRDIALADGKVSEEEQKRLNSLLAAQMSYLKISSTIKEIKDSSTAVVTEASQISQFTHRTRMQTVKLKDEYNAMVTAQKERKKFLDDELIVMQQVVKQSGKLLSNLREFRPDKVYGGRGGDPRKMAADYMNQLGYKSIDELIEELTGAPDKVREVADPLADLKARIGMERDLMHVSDARRQVMEAIFQSERQYSPEQINQAVKLVDAYNKQVKEMERIKSTADMIGNAFENAFMSMIDGTKSAKDAFKDLTRSIIADLYRQYVVKQITGFITQSVGAMMAGPVQGPNLPSANGGGYTGNGARAGGLDGRGGFMAMLHPRETIVDHTKGQGSGVVVNQTINVSTGVQQTVRTEIKSLMPQIAESAKSAVFDAQRRSVSGRGYA